MSKDKFVKTGVFASKKEATAIKKMMKIAANTPMICFDPMTAINPWDAVYKLIHKVALSHGLPEIPGYYGFNADSGEFLRIEKA